MRLASSGSSLHADGRQFLVLLVTARTRLMPIANHLEQAGFGVRREENLDFVGDETPLGKFDWVVLDMALSRRAIQSFCDKMWADQRAARGLTLLCDEAIDQQDRENLCQVWVPRTACCTQSLWSRLKQPLKAGLSEMRSQPKVSRTLGHGLTRTGRRQLEQQRLQNFRHFEGR